MNIARLNLQRKALADACKALDVKLNELDTVQAIAVAHAKGGKTALMCDTDRKGIAEIIATGKANKKTVRKLIMGIERAVGNDIATLCAVITISAERLAKALDD